MGKNTVDFSVLDKAQLPRHVAIIMDGNGRWAKKRLLPRPAGHRVGTERVCDIVRTSSDLGISALTLFAFSTENWKRPKDEVGVLMSLLVDYIQKEMDDLHKNNVRFRFIGQKRLPQRVLEVMTNAEEKMSKNTGLDLCIAVDYGSRDEILSAVALTAEQFKRGEIMEVTAREFEANLFTQGIVDPDFVIRTSGELRLSNFLLYQAAYAELYFTDVLWPDFDESQYLKALLEFQSRSRRFGAL